MSEFEAEITIEDTDRAGRAESATTIGKVNFSSVQTFVENVLWCATAVANRGRCYGDSQIRESNALLLAK